MTNSDALREIAVVGAKATASAVPAATVAALAIAVGVVLVLAGLRWHARRRDSRRIADGDRDLGPILREHYHDWVAEQQRDGGKDA